MTRHEAIAAALLIAAGLVWSSTAGAEQAFLCEDGRIALARDDAELERLKRDDACVAAYFDLTVQAKGAAPQPASAPTAAADTPKPVELRPSSAREVVARPERSAARPFHNVDERMRAAAAGEAPAQPLAVINAGATAKAK